MARLFSAKPKDAAEAAQFQSGFKKHGRYTAGVETRYDPSLITATDDRQHLASGLQTGMRFHSAPVIRLADGKLMEFGHTIKADGRWRLIAFAGKGDEGQKDSDIANLGSYLSENTDSIVMRFVPKGAESDSVCDLRAVFQSSHRDMRLETLPKMLLPTKGRHGLID
jgi:phenol 2-monooxygenase